MVSFSTLPVELKLYIGRFLLTRDLVSYATSCSALWYLSRNLLAKRRKKNEYWCLHLDQERSEDNARIREIYDDPSLLDLVSAVVLWAAEEPVIDRTLFGYGKELPALSTRELDAILVEAIEAPHEQRLAVFDRLMKHGCPKSFIPLFTRNVELLLFTSVAGVQQMLTQVYQPLHFHLHLLFPNISHIRIAQHDLGGPETTLFELKLLARMPTVRSIRCEFVWHEPERIRIRGLSIKELELIDVRVFIEEPWRDFFKTFTSLERLHYTHDVWFNDWPTTHIPRVIIDCLLRAASKTLAVLILDDRHYYVSNVSPCAILKGFSCLTVLRCSWRDIVPVLHLSFPPMNAEDTEEDSPPDRSPQLDPLLEVVQQTSDYKTLLVDILPPTLKHLTLNKCPYSELHLLEEYISSDICKLETLWFTDSVHPLDTGEHTRVDRIINLMRAQGIRFSDGCAEYARRAAPESWVEYQLFDDGSTRVS